MYIPNTIYNQNYSYYINGSNILIVTNNNCYTNINNQYCDCITYNPEQKIYSNTKSCTTNQNLYSINFNQFTNKDYHNIWNIIPFIIGILLFIALVRR